MLESHQAQFDFTNVVEQKRVARCERGRESAFCLGAHAVRLFTVRRSRRWSGSTHKSTKTRGSPVAALGYPKNDTRPAIDERIL